MGFDVMNARGRNEESAMMPDELVRRWETVYFRYTEASKLTATSTAGDQHAVREMAAASSELAVVWRQMESTLDMPWWTLAALGTAAQAFEVQARDWKARAANAWPIDGGGPPRRQLATRARPRSRREVGGGRG